MDNLLLKGVGGCSFKGLTVGDSCVDNAVMYVLGDVDNLPMCLYSG